MFFRSEDRSVPSTDDLILPGALPDALMQRINVDFPDPDGPHTTIRSP